MSVIAMIQQKGGVGKSTITANLAGALVSLGHTVSVLDLDPQQSLVSWAQFGEGLLRTMVEPVDTTNPKALKEALRRVGGHSGRILLDCPPGLLDPAIAAALVSDMALLPVSPSPLDFKASKEAVELVRDVSGRRKDGKPTIAFVPSRVEEQTVIGRDLVASLRKLGVPVLPGISKRIALAESVLTGLTIGEYAPASPGVEEFKTLAVAVERMLSA